MSKKQSFYEELSKSLASLLADSPTKVACLANASALIFETVEDLNWVGFYELNEAKDALYLGPFQGKVACQILRLGKGVCGTAIAERKAIRVDDVHAFPGHIACDAASASELVIPLSAKDELYGVLDIDSPRLSRFDEEDVAGFRLLSKVIERKLNELN